MTKFYLSLCERCGHMCWVTYEECPLCHPDKDKKRVPYLLHFYLRDSMLDIGYAEVWATDRAEAREAGPQIHRSEPFTIQKVEGIDQYTVLINAETVNE